MRSVGYPREGPAPSSGAPPVYAGRAVDGPENNKIAGWAGGKPAIILAVSKQPEPT